MNPDFISNQKLSGISPEKLNFLLSFANQNKTGNAKEMSSLVTDAVQSAQKENINFSPDETDLVIEVLKQNMSPEERRKAEQLLTLMKRMKKK